MLIKIILIIQIPTGSISHFQLLIFGGENITSYIYKNIILPKGWRGSPSWAKSGLWSHLIWLAVLPATVPHATCAAPSTACCMQCTEPICHGLHTARHWSRACSACSTHARLTLHAGFGALYTTCPTGLKPVHVIT